MSETRETTSALDEQLTHLVRCAILAPSCHNTQPWRFQLTDEHIWLYADRSRHLRYIDPRARQLHMSCGAALLNMRVAARAFFSKTPLVYLFPAEREPDLIARLSLGLPVSATRSDHDLATAIMHRHTNRRPFEERRVNHTILAEILSGIEEEGAWGSYIGHSTRRHLADLIGRADEIQFSDREYRRELASWIDGERVDRGDGIPTYAMGKGLFANLPVVIRHFNLGGIERARERVLVEHAPLILIIGTRGDEPRDWVRAGQAVERALLIAQKHGISASFLNRVIEIDHLRAQVSEIAEREGAPQLVLRLGYGPPTRPTPRRPLHEVLITP